jgi:lysophospholipase L1-like esterase
VAATAPQSVEPDTPVTIVTLGDSITRGVRAGVKPDETFASLIEADLKAKGIAGRVVNRGIGGERTDQAIARLAKDVVALRPRLVSVMYGTNDSYVDAGKSSSRLTLDEYRANLRAIVAALRLEGIEPVLMTEPRWAADARNGLGENPNLRLEPYVGVCRQVAAEWELPLVDHFAHWTQAERAGQAIREWTTDGCHPNPRGHRELADLMVPGLLGVLRPAPVTPAKVDIRLETVQEHDDGQYLWYHPRVAVAPAAERGGNPTAMLTLQKHLHVSDYYSGLHVMRSLDLGKTWTRPKPQPELDWVHDGNVVLAVADVTPGWHAATKKVLAVGALVRYSKKGEQLEDKPRAHQTAYAVHDPATGRWSRWRTFEMPADDKFNFARSACAQWLVEPDGSLLLPFYFGPSATTPYSVTVVRAAFDGEHLKYVEHGDELALNVVRGLCEPSLVRFGARYYLTIRNDLKGYVTSSRDGLHFRPIQPWRFDDGAELGSYNTQQHWVTTRDGLFLAYTRRGANNDHIVRHRAPLFIGQVDPATLQVVRATERVLIAERGGEFGNFGATAISERESWVTVCEGVWNDDARRRGAKGALFLARVISP